MMKRIVVLSLLWGLLLALPMFAQDKASQIASLQGQIDTIEQNFVPLKARLDDLTALKSRNDFALDAYKKYSAKYSTDLADFNVRRVAVNREQELLNPSINNYTARAAAHNAHQCVEYNHDGSCNWYNQEAAQLDANKAQLQQAQNAIDAKQAPLDTEKQGLDTTKAQLQTIYDQDAVNVEKYRQGMDQLKSEVFPLVDKENALLRQIAILKGNTADCMKAIPPECEKPQIGPDGKPILNQKCEQMVAQCRAAFDGSKP